MVYEAAFHTGTRDEAEGAVVVEAFRYAGVPNPEGELQRAHQEAAAAVLDGAAIGHTLAGSGVVVSGSINPLHSVGVLAAHETSFRGSCFAFRHSNLFVTAAHCVEGLDPQVDDVVVDLPRSIEKYRVETIVIHPRADVAVLRLGDDVWTQGVEPFTGIARPELGPGGPIDPLGGPIDLFRRPGQYRATERKEGRGLESCLR